MASLILKITDMPGLKDQLSSSQSANQIKKLFSNCVNMLSSNCMEKTQMSKW